MGYRDNETLLASALDVTSTGAGVDSSDHLDLAHTNGFGEGVNAEARMTVTTALSIVGSLVLEVQHASDGSTFSNFITKEGIVAADVVDGGVVRLTFPTDKCNRYVKMSLDPAASASIAAGVVDMEIVPVGA